MDGGKPTLLVEVFSRKESDDYRLQVEYVEDLRERVKGIPIGSLLDIRISPSGSSLLWNDGTVNTLFERIKEWLAKCPFPNQRIEIDGVEVFLVGYSESLRHVEISTGPFPFTVDSGPVYRSIEEKLLKYESICRQHRMRFVVACCPGFSTAIGRNEIAEICPDLFAKYERLFSVWAFINEGVEVFNNPSNS